MNGLTRNRVVIGMALFIVVCIALTLFLSRPGEARGSVLSRGPNGWLAARKYLEARGARVALLDGPLDRVKERGVLVSSFPWQGGFSAEAGEQIEEHLRRGGDVVLAYSGEQGNAGEMVALEGLGLPLEKIRKVVLNPLKWRRFAREEWDLRPAGELAGVERVRIWAPRFAPEVPKDARVILRSPQGRPAGAILKRHRGRLWLLPADAFANSRLENPGNADLLEALRRRLGEDWTFDEYHHGLAGRQPVESAALGTTLDLILLHLAVLYVVALLTLSRRFGPAWSEPPVVTGSAGSFLLGLGALHDRLGHHTEAARRLLERARELDRNLVLPADLDGRAASAGPRELVELARQVARLRSGGRPGGERNFKETDA
ncbi:MAG TPA: DUF4350 domain-containing protein [Thermoanaerobaculia bacterium]|nr:DUF4350 domain-containing protein [Thermoanaerobaculia bacterium]